MFNKVGVLYYSAVSLIAAGLAIAAESVVPVFIILGIGLFIHAMKEIIPEDFFE